MIEALDKTDHTILQLLQSDSSLSVAEIAQQVNLSQAPCWRRIHRLEEQGFITARVALLDRKALGLNLVLYTEVKLTDSNQETLADFEQAVCQFPEVTECYTMLGRQDFLLRIVTRDVESYEKFFRRHLSKLPHVHDINSNVALSEIKRTNALPLSLTQ